MRTHDRTRTPEEEEAPGLGTRLCPDGDQNGRRAGLRAPPLQNNNFIEVLVMCHKIHS